MERHNQDPERPAVAYLSLEQPRLEIASNTGQRTLEKELQVDVRSMEAVMYDACPALLLLRWLRLGFGSDG